MEEASLCLICGNVCDFSVQSVVNKPTKKGLLNIVNVAESRQDNCAKNILLHKNAILSGVTNFKFHTSCRSSYISKENIETVASIRPEQTAIPSSSNEQHRTRSTDFFEIRKMCLFCKKQE